MTQDVNKAADQAASSFPADVPARPVSMRDRFKDPARWKKSLTDLALWFMYGLLVTTMLSRFSPGYPIVVGTASIQPGIYWLDRQAESFHRGNFVSFPFRPAQEWLQSRYGEGRVFTKQVKAVAGDTVYADANGSLKACYAIYAASDRICEDLGQILEVDSVGRPMTAWIPPNHEYTLREGELWVYAPNKRSLDSRYYGPVRTETVEGRASPMVLWGE